MNPDDKFSDDDDDDSCDNRKLPARVTDHGRHDGDTDNDNDNDNDDDDDVIEKKGKCQEAFEESGTSYKILCSP
jgi:hypothetical protein